MPTRSGIRISGFPVEVTETDDALTLESEGTRDLVLSAGSGKVGIGTTDPAKNLHIYGASGEVELRIQSDYSFSSIVHKDVGNELIIQNAATDGVTIFHDDTTERMRIDKDGNVGIGTNAPAEKFHVVGDTALVGDVGVGTANPAKNLHVYGASGEVELRIQSDTSFCSIVQKDNNEMIIQNAASGGVMIFHDDTAERMRIDSDGDATFAGDVTVTGEVIASAGIDVKNGSTGAGFVNFYEDSDNGTNKVSLVGPASTADVTLTLPASADTLVGKATTDTLTNKTLTAPKIADDGYIADGAGNEQLVFVQTDNAVNHWAMTNAIAGSPAVLLQAAGDTGNVHALIAPKGTGSVAFTLQHADGTVKVIGASSAEATLELQADDGASADQWKVSATDESHFLVESKASGSFADMFDINGNGSAAPGGGFDRSGGVTSYVSKLGAEIVTTIHVDLGAAVAESTTNEESVIGEDGVAAAYITQLSTATNGVIYRAEMSCIETPTTGQTDIDLVGNSLSLTHGVLYDSSGTHTVVIAAGAAWAAGMSQQSASRVALVNLTSDYLYLTAGAAGTDGEYGAGQFIIKLYGAVPA